MYHVSAQGMINVYYYYYYAEKRRVLSADLKETAV